MESTNKVCFTFYWDTPLLLIDVKDVTLMNTKYTKEQNVELLNKNTQYNDVKLISQQVNKRKHYSLNAQQLLI